MTLLFMPDALRLGEDLALLHKLEAQNCPVSASPWGRSLPKLKSPFFPLPFVNFRNHYSFVRTSIEVIDRHEIRLIDNPNKSMKESIHVYKLYVINY